MEKEIQLPEKLVAKLRDLGSRATLMNQMINDLVETFIEARDLKGNFKISNDMAKLIKVEDNKDKVNGISTS